MIETYGPAKVFVAHNLNPIPWKTSTTTKDGNLENYQQSLKVILERDYTEEQRSFEEGPLDVNFYFRRSTAGGQPADVSNLTKATEDAIQGVLIGNDRHDYRVCGEMNDQTPSTRPMVIIVIAPYVPSAALKYLARQFDVCAPPQEFKYPPLDHDTASVF